MSDKFEKAEKLNIELQSKLQASEQVKKEIKRHLDKNGKNVEALDSTLSCLSCLEYLKDPLTLNCGHSICNKCFTTHSDPNSKDSLVFCEECKVETKNKMIKDQLVMRIICDKYGGTRETLKAVGELVK